jgi:alkylation response protein AidB-like acyl-CoA dehydrogenase
VAFLRWWAGELRASGWFAPHWPKEYGGGFSLAEQVVIAEELVRGDAPRNALHQVALYNAAPAIIHAGTAAQRDRHLRGMLEGEVWCQGFSEPDAGSDLASLSTSAARDGDRYVVHGQKVWTSYAMEADWCILLARTDPTAPKHRGLSYLLVDMRSDGVDVRPIRQATGAAEFCELFLDGVSVPVDQRVGDENDGWRVAQGTLASERSVVVLELAERLLRNGVTALVEAVGSWRLEDGSAAGDDESVRELLAERYAEARVLRDLVRAQIDQVARGGTIGAEASVIKVFYTELLQRTMRDALELAGLAGQVDQPLLEAAGWESGNWFGDFLNSWGWTISGGPNEIMRNIIGERLLGLPREPAPGP